jgi:SAM-dependent methyltransferase
MASIKPELDMQLKRQSMWLKESWMWLLEKKVLSSKEGKSTAGLKALDVGCGAGLVMEILGELLDVKGVDIDPGMVDEARKRGFDVSQADALNLPYEDSSFDIVYCSFLLLWVRDPVKAVSEMKRVSRRWVLALAEPDFGARIDYPENLAKLTQLIIQGMREDGGDPTIGRKLRSVFGACGLKADIGVHPGVWDLDKLYAETMDEWRWIDMTVNVGGRKENLSVLRTAWIDALKKGSLFQFNPFFYAFAKK